MGGADLDTLHQTAEMATAKPRERQFQVVPVPGVFTRGRWKCWDYRDDTQTQSEKRDILDFEKEKDKGDNSSDMSTTILPVSTNEVLVDNGSSYNSLSEMTNTLETTPVKERESSTIVVTSIAPAPPTPQHGTPQSMSEAVDRMNLGLDLQKGIYAQQNYSISDQMSISPVGVVSHSSGDLIGSHIVQQQIPTMSQVSSVPSNISTQSVPIVPIRPSTSEASPVEDDCSSTTNGANVPTPNVAAIDNKIEQAMDLVKTHLTFAVREEVEVLRQTITDLEQRVSALESENQLLRQYAPVEVVNNLASLVQQQKAASIPPVNPASTLLQALPPPKVPTGFCSSSFATSLNNVVAEVRHEFTSQNAMNELQGPLTKH